MYNNVDFPRSLLKLIDFVTYIVFFAARLLTLHLDTEHHLSADTFHNMFSHSGHFHFQRCCGYFTNQWENFLADSFAAQS
jgi:hypothetical protein